jgi:ABC-type multidrug transport system fused ATPase/permease subunit
MVMRPSGTIPFVVSILVGFLLGLVTVGLLRLRRSPTDDSILGANDVLLLGLLILAAFALGVFLTYVFFGVLI